MAKSTNAESTIILFVGIRAFFVTRLRVIDDRKTAKDLWDQLSKHYTTSSIQMVRNLKQKLETLFFDEHKGSWDTHVTAFFSICDELGTYDEERRNQQAYTILA